MTYWHCKCQCGTECDKSSQYLRSNKYASCGSCIPRKIRLDHKNLVGCKFGRLTVIEIDLEKRQQQFEDNKNKKKKNYKIYWKCLCECNNTVSVREDHLKEGRILSCGCYQKEIVKTVVPPKNWKTNETIEIDGYLLIKASNEDRYIKIDKEDYEKVKDYCWCISNGYAVAPIRGEKNKFIRMHRIIMNCGDDEEYLTIDHINHDTIDNRKNNLRIATDAENSWNSASSHNSGIKYNENLDKWNVFIFYKLQKINLGVFDRYDEALEIRDKAEKVFYDEFQYKDNGGI